jgi:hypothetical protein
MFWKIYLWAMRKTLTSKNILFWDDVRRVALLLHEDMERGQSALFKDLNSSGKGEQYFIPDGAVIYTGPNTRVYTMGKS